jgi:hypothetical protein
MCSPPSPRGATVPSAGDAEAVRILAVPGSLRSGSHTAALLRAATHVAPAGVRLGPLRRPARPAPYDEHHDRPPAPPAVPRLRRPIAAADAVLFSTPGPVLRHRLEDIVTLLADTAGDGAADRAAWS